jgi:hypothetical protein
MSRPRKNPVERFNDILPLWNAAELQSGVEFTAPNENTAINIVYRLNQYRKIMREMSDIEHTSLDSFVVRREGRIVIIMPRPTFDLSTMRTLDGRPIEHLYREPPRPSNFDPNNIRPPTSAEQIEIDKAAAELRKQGLID